MLQRQSHISIRSRARRAGFTIVEMLVVMALIIIILAILAEAFAIGVKSLRTGKAIGDMQENLRSAGNLIRRDLAADHFGGRRRLSDYDPTSGAVLPKSREGFFHLIPPAGAATDVREGNDQDGLPSRRTTDIVLHFAVKLRGNAPDQFFSAGVPGGSPLLVSPTTFFDQPADARFQPNGNIYNGQWAEVAYYMQANGNMAGNVPLFDLYRTELVGVSNPNTVNNLVASGNLNGYLGISCVPNGNNLKFLSPINWGATPSTRAFNQGTRPGTVVLTDVVSFDVQGLWHRYFQNPNNNWWWGWYPDPDFNDYTATTPPPGPLQQWTGQDYDTSSGSPWPMRSIRVTIRVWDFKTSLTRQATVIQDM